MKPGPIGAFIPACASSHTGVWRWRARTGAARTPPWPPCTPQTTIPHTHRTPISCVRKGTGNPRAGGGTRRRAPTPSSSTYIERHELRRPGVERQRGLALVDAVAGEHPPVVRAVGRAPSVPAVPPRRRRRRGPRVEVVGVARGGDGARGEGGGLPGGGSEGRGEG